MLKKRIDNLAEKNRMQEDWDWPEGVWPVTDTLFRAKELHKEENKTKLIDREALLQGWSEKVFCSDETRKAWKQATKKKSLSSLTQKLGLS
jgi:hypothetical protein